MLFSTPEYAGALPGSFKNLLDWLIGDAEPRSIYEKPVAWINASPRGAPNAHAELRTVLGFAHATIVESACVHVPITDPMIDPDGLVTDADARATITAALDALSARPLMAQAGRRVLWSVCGKRSGNSSILSIGVLVVRPLAVADR